MPATRKKASRTLLAAISGWQDPDYCLTRLQTMVHNKNYYVYHGKGTIRRDPDTVKPNDWVWII